ncbi:hypothetical protein HON22_01130, partial [Candidatus Peregrinibacteria bacterium]|nr:hypothetical protein [Candidatus Peregrinibacteria bacterium]
MPPKKKDSLQATPPKKAVKKTVSKKGKKVPKKKVKQNKLQKLQIFFQKYFSYILTGAISTSILFLFAYYFISKSYFYNYIPKNTQKFVHIELTKARGALDFYSGIKEIMQSDIDEEILKKLVELKIPYLTLLSDKENSSAFLIEKISEKKAKIFLKSFQSTEEELTFHKENNISSISILSGKETYCVHKTYTLFCSSTAQGTTSFKDGNFSDPKTLKNKIKKIPYQSFIRWYINPQSLDTPFLEVHKDFLQDIYGGVKIKKEDTIEVFMDIKTQTQREKATEKSENFLSKYFSKDDTLFYLSGKNFQNRWITIEEYYKEKSPEYALILKGILQKKISELFGNEIDFYSDILPLFEKEFAFAINKIQEESFISFISQTKQFT